MLPLKLAIRSYKFLMNISRNHTDSINFLTATTLKLAIAPDHMKIGDLISPKPYRNCRMKESCSLNSDCLQSSVVYGCKITSNDTAEDSPYYIGLA